MPSPVSHDYGERFSEKEASLLVDAFNGTFFSFDPRTELVMGVEECTQYDDLAGKWEVDVEGLVAKLRRMSPATARAVVSGVQKFWAGGGDRSLAESLVRSGLTTMTLTWEDGTGGQPPLSEPHESRNTIDRAVAADSYTSGEAVRWLSHRDQRVRDYARGKLPNVRPEPSESTD